MKLRNCPYCGRKAETFQFPENTALENELHPHLIWKNPGKWTVGCTGEPTCCGSICHAPIFITEEEAANAWNGENNERA